MANNSKKKTVNDTNVEQQVVAPVETKVEAPAPKQNKKFAAGDLITCRSVTNGKLVLAGAKSKLNYTWANYGDTTEVEFQDLQALYSTKSKFIFAPLFIIEDEDLVDNWKSAIGSLYDKLYTSDFEAMFKLTPAQLKSKLKALPDGIKDSVKSMAAEKINNGELDSVARIKVIDEVFGTEFITMID